MQSDSQILPSGMVEWATFRTRFKTRRCCWFNNEEILVVPVVPSANNGEVQLWGDGEDKEGRLAQLIDCPGEPMSVDVCAQTSQIAYSMHSGEIRILESEVRFGSRTEKEIGIHKGPVTDIKWSPDGEMLATASHDQTICILNRGSQFKRARRIQATYDRHNAVSWSPTGHQLASCGSEYGIHLFDAETGQLIWKSDKSSNINFLDLAWSGGPRELIAVGLSDGRIWLLDPRTGQTKAELEGNTQGVLSVAFSLDGRLLFSLGEDSFIRIWRRDEFPGNDAYALIGKVPSSAQRGETLSSLTCHRTKPLLAAPSVERGELIIWKYDADLMAMSKPIVPTIESRTTAKVALVGDSGIGKSCLAMRLAEGRYAEVPTTHGMRVWSIASTQLDPKLSEPEWKNREVILWDMGGQREYRLIHQLFLHDTTLALVLFDPTRRDAAYSDVEAWVKRLQRQLRGHSANKILVGSKIDEDTGLIDSNHIREVCEHLHFLRYLPTSAKVNRGIGELGEAIIEGIDWNGLGRTIRPELFQNVRDEIDALKSSGEIVVRISTLIEILTRKTPNGGSGGKCQIAIADVNAVVTQLSLQGVIVEARLGNDERALVLQIGEIERYASSLLIAAGNNPRGIAALEEYAVLNMRAFPGIRDEERLPASQERAVLDAVIQLLLQNGICLRQDGMLIFPSMFRSGTSATIQQPVETVSAYYDFSGAVENIYASLIASLSATQRFGRVRLWSDRADFVSEGEVVCGVVRIDLGGGYAQLNVYWSPQTPGETRSLFRRFIEDHLTRYGIETFERLNLHCNCGEIFNEDTLRTRLSEGKRTVVCPRCEFEHDLNELVSGEREVLARAEAAQIRYRAKGRTAEIVADVATKMRKVDRLRHERSNSTRQILHLSDLHISDTTDPIALLEPLVADLECKELAIDSNNREAERKQLLLDHIDYLVISGDITNSASEKEFGKAHEFISLLLDRLHLGAERCVITPGNHDLNWAEQVYGWRSARGFSEKEFRPGSYSKQGDVYLVADQDKYPLRFRNFSEKLYHPLMQQEYPLKVDEQATPFFFPDDRVQFIALNSSWEIDEFHPGRAGVNAKALASALGSARAQVNSALANGLIDSRKGILRIAVLHHPIDGSDSIKDVAFMELLQQAGFRVCLHGHVHKLENKLFNYLRPGAIHVISAGSFGAPGSTRPESTPYLYNIVQIGLGKTVRVSTRARSSETGAWRGWAVWPSDRVGEQRSSYQFEWEDREDDGLQDVD